MLNYFFNCFLVCIGYFVWKSTIKFLKVFPGHLFIPNFVFHLIISEGEGVSLCNYCCCFCNMYCTTVPADSMLVTLTWLFNKLFTQMLRLQLTAKPHARGLAYVWSFRSPCKHVFFPLVSHRLLHFICFHSLRNCT